MCLSRICLPAALTVVVLTLGGCNSNDQQASNQNPDSRQGTAAASSQPSPRGSKPRATSPSQPSAAVPQPAPPPPPQVVELPAGTEISIRIDQELSSRNSQPGEAFPATVAQDVTLNGLVIIPKESRAAGTVVDARPLGKFKGGALLSIKLNRVQSSWGSYPVNTASISRAENGKGKRSAAFIGGGAGLGALVGGLAGGGRGAAVGALAGGGAGTAGAALTGNKEIVLPAETQLTFRLANSVHITQDGRSDNGGDPELKTR
jgi:hypothetical protein